MYLGGVRYGVELEAFIARAVEQAELAEERVGSMAIRL